MDDDQVCEEISSERMCNTQLKCEQSDDSSTSSISTTGSPNVDKVVNEKMTIMKDGLSKKQRKRLLKREKWLEVRKLKRAKEKEKLKLKKKIALQNNVKLGPSRKELKYNKMSSSKCKVRVVVDLSFNGLMNDKDIGKCVKQIHHCYSVNRRYPDPIQFYLTSFCGRLAEDMEKHDGFRNWDVNFSSEHFTQLFKLNELVYLTSDSDNIITSLEEDKVYIIGGLVDHNSQKGLCLRVAQDAGISHGQLPIGEFLQMATRKTLTIDHVFEIMHGVCHGKTWEEALLQVIPPRKGAQAKVKELSKGSSESNDLMGNISREKESGANQGSDRAEGNEESEPSAPSDDHISKPDELAKKEDT